VPAEAPPASGDPAEPASGDPARPAQSEPARRGRDQQPRPARTRPGWGHQTSLFQFREPAFWLYLLLLAVTAIVTVRQQGYLRAVSPSAWALSWALLALYLVPMVACVYVLDLYEREPPSLVLGALLYGAVCATALAALANDGWARCLRAWPGRTSQPAGPPRSPRRGPRSWSRAAGWCCCT
jgi:hypothetical protein